MAGAWLEVFKSGTHTSGNGVTKTYTDEDIKNIAQTYNDQKDHEAPLVLGHPNTDDPAYGWTKQLKEAGGKLLAYVDQVSDSIVAAVNRGEYKKVSIALYPDGLLRHVGLLGAVPPAVKGLASVQFAEGLEFEEYVWATDEYRMPRVGRILSGLRDFFIEKFGLDATDKILNKDDIASLQESATSKMLTLDDQGRIVPPENINVSPPGAITNYGEEITQEQEEEYMENLRKEVTDLKDAMAAQSSQFSEQIAKLTELVTCQIQDTANKTKLTAFETSKNAFSAFAENLSKEGKILPAEKDGIIEEYADLLQAEEVMTFAEGIVKPSEKMKARLEARPVIFARGTTFADPHRGAPPKLDAQDVPVQFAEMADRIDSSSLEIDRVIREYAETNKVTYEEAAAQYAAA